MVVFNDLRISDDKKSLIVDCFVEDLPVYSEVYITSIDVDYYKNVETSGAASGNSINIYTDNGEHNRAVHVRLTKSNIEQAVDFGTNTLDGGLFYVFVTCSDDVSASVVSLPCGYDRNIDIGIVPDWEKLYEIGMQYIIDMAGICFDTCSSNSIDVSFLLLWNSLKLAMDAGEFNLVNRTWERIYRMYHYNGATVSGSCGCKNN